MNNIEKLINAIKGQSELFLVDSGEFAPFATYIRARGELTFISAYSETTNSKEMYEILLKSAYDDLNDLDIRAFAIGLDGRFKGEDVLVVEIILSVEDRYQAIYPYTIVSGKVAFGDKM
jgi:hypothetical protein